MAKSDVYFTNMRCPVGTSLLTKLDKLMQKAGIERIDFEKKYAAIKIHFGEPGNLSFLRPNFAKTVADRVTALGGMPFLTDSNTLYVGRRNNALAHLGAAHENGFSPLSTGCHVIIADGLKGTDDIEVPVTGGKYFTSARIGRAIMDADIFISLNHFKGHEATGFGGAIKNIGMGSGSRAGKMAMHNNGKPSVNPKKCVGCRVCARYCNEAAIFFNDDKRAEIDAERCVGCGRCIGTCNYHAIANRNSCSNDELNCKMAEYAKAVVEGRPHFHISVINQVSPFCDCHGDNDSAVIPDLGILASFDPVALDRACIDLVNAAPVIPGSILDDSRKTGLGNTGGTTERNGANCGCQTDKKGWDDHFNSIHPKTDWRSQIKHAQEIGLGNSEYNLITVS